MAIKILIVDDHAVVREGLKQILEGVSGMAVTGEAGTGAEALQAIESQRFNVVVLDISLPNASGIDILTRIRADHPQIAVLVLSIHPEEQYAARAIQAGASGYLTKDAAPDELAAAIRKVAWGGRYVSAALAEKLNLDPEPEAGLMPHKALSNREFQVLCLIGSGKTVTEIAGLLHLSTKTVSTYRRHILEKMGMQSNAELIRYAIENRLVD